MLSKHLKLRVTSDKFKSDVYQILDERKYIKIILYYVGMFFKAINKYFDISKSDIFAILDTRFISNSNDKTVFHYSKYSNYDMVIYE